MFKFLCSIILALVCITNHSTAQVELLSNGDFETGDLSFWSTAQNGNGDYYLATNPTGALPHSTQSAGPNPDGGGFVAISDMIFTQNTGSHALIQSFTVPPNAIQVTLYWDHILQCDPAIMFIGDSSFVGGFDEKQFGRVDLLSAAAPAFEEGAGLLKNYFAEEVNYVPTTAMWMENTRDMTSDVTPGETYQIRFADAGCNYGVNFGIDNVSILVVVADTPSIPTLSQWGLFLFGLIFFAMGLVIVYNKKLKLRTVGVGFPFSGHFKSGVI